MPVSISTAAIAEKNKVTSEGRFLLLLEVIYSESEPSARFVWNNEDLIWGGHTWNRAAFALGDLSETKEAELPSVDLVVKDINRVLIPALAANSGAIGAGVWIRWITTALSESTPLLEEFLEITDCDISGAGQVSFKLGAEDVSTWRSPGDRFLKQFCRYGPRHGGFKGPYCGYRGSEAHCDRSYARCNELGNGVRFGGFLGVGRSGVYA